MLGSLTAIIFSGMLNFVGKKYPQLTGEGRLQPAGVGEDLTNINADKKGSTVDITAIAGAGLTAIVLCWA
jgi:Na+/citrate or Na+/malate symporter